MEGTGMTDRAFRKGNRDGRAGGYRVGLALGWMVWWNGGTGYAGAAGKKGGRAGTSGRQARWRDGQSRWYCRKDADPGGGGGVGKGGTSEGGGGHGMCRGATERMPPSWWNGVCMRPGRAV